MRAAAVYQLLPAYRIPLTRWVSFRPSQHLQGWVLFILAFTLLSSEVLDEDKKRELAAIYGALNPVTLRKQIIRAVEYLWTLADRQYSTTNKQEKLG